MFSILEITKRLMSALIFGGIIGIERERRGRAAGLRTHILVSLGSALIMLVSIYMFEIYGEKGAVDPSRIAAGVITGIGFLGAGTIIRSGDGIIGLTTAATIWVSAGIGLACGCGFIEGAFLATILCLIVLCLLRKFEGVLKKEDKQEVKYG